MLLQPLRFLNPSLTPMKLHSTLQSSRSIPVFCRIFPFKLKYQALSRKLGFPILPNQELAVRNFSTRPFRSRTGSSGARTLEVRASKSLVDDEAELSDWVSELKTDSFRTRLSSKDNDDDDGDIDRGRSRDRVAGRDSFSTMKSQRGGDRDRGRDSFSAMKTQRGGDRDRGRDSFSAMKTQRGGDRDRVGVSSLKRRRDGESGDFDGGSSRRFESVPKNSRVGKRFGSEMEKKDDEFTLQRRNSGSRGPGLGKRGGRDSEMGYRRDQGGEGLRKGDKGLGRQALSTSDDEIDNGGVGFKDLISEEDSEEGDDVSENDDDDFKNASSLFGSNEEVIPRIVPITSPGRSDSYLSETRFDQCSISPLSLKGIKSAGYENMTVVQEATLPFILKGKDVLAKAKTGTGKTVAFLLPSIEVVVKSPPAGRDQKRPPIIVLVICPTRELANQAAAEANSLLKYHPSIGVQVVIGGTRLTLEQKRMQANPCQILVATPGRLKDHIENTAGFATRLMGVKVLILDEADHLLDMGFRKDIEKIIAAVPKQRQTLLFSATVPEEVRQICHIALKRDHEFINTVQEGSEETHSQVRQMHLVAPLDKHFSLLYVLLKEHISDDVDYKVLVFCTTAMVTRLVADLLGELNLNVREIHSRKPQSYRTRISDEFRKSKGLILVTSDVSARGVDYPDVTLVIQMGLPADKEQYIHRLGRTGRKGKEGQGILLLTPWEEFFLSAIKDLPITKAPVPSVDPDTRKKVERALSNVEMKNKEAAYQAWLGYYNSNKKVGRDKHKLVELANEFSRSMGLDNPPAIPKLVLGKMGLKNVPGLRSR